MKIYLNTIEMIIAPNIITLASKKVLMHCMGYKILLIVRPKTGKTSMIMSEMVMIAPIEPNMSIL